MRQSVTAVLAGLALCGCATSKPRPVPEITCYQWTLLLKDGLIRPGLDRSAVHGICQHFGIPRASAWRSECSTAPSEPRWNCFVEDYSCDRGDLSPGTVRVVYRLKKGTPTGPADPDDVPGSVWVVDYRGFHDANDGSPAPGARPGGPR